MPCPVMDGGVSDSHPATCLVSNATRSVQTTAECSDVTRQRLKFIVKGYFAVAVIARARLHWYQGLCDETDYEGLKCLLIPTQHAPPFLCYPGLTRRLTLFAQSMVAPSVRTLACGAMLEQVSVQCTCLCYLVNEDNKWPPRLRSPRIRCG